MRWYSGVASLLMAALLAAMSMASSDIHEAAKAGDLEQVRSLLASNMRLLDAKKESGINGKERGQSPLHAAAAAGHADIVTFLADQGEPTSKAVGY